MAIDFDEIHHSDCVAGSRVLVFLIPPRPVGIPIKYDGRYWMRKEDSLVEMSEDRLREIFAESGHDFTADAVSGLTLDDLDESATGAYTRKKGLDREHNLALLKKHIDENATVGSKLDELCQVIPSLRRTHVQSLLQTLKRRGLAHPQGKRRAGVWYPGSAADGGAQDDA